MQEIILSIYAIVAFVVALIIVKINRRNNSVGVKIQHLMEAVFCLIIFYTLNFMTDNLFVMKIGNSLSLFMLDFLVLFFLDYVLEYLDWQEKFPMLLKIFFYMFVALDGLALLSNPFNNEAFDYVEVEIGNATILSYQPKTAFHAHLLLIIVLVSISIFLLILKCFHTPRLYWKRFYCIWLGLLMAVITNCVYFSEIYQSKIDFSVLAYGFLGILLYFDIFTYQSVVNKAITRGVILDYLSEPVILFDYEGILADYTVHMKDLIPGQVLKRRNTENGQPLTRGNSWNRPE